MDFSASSKFTEQMETTDAEQTERVLGLDAQRSDEGGAMSKRASVGPSLACRFLATLLLLSAILAAMSVMAGPESLLHDRSQPCPARWPVFASRAELFTNKPWAAYLHAVYGGVPDEYPLCMGDLWMFYEEELAAHDVSEMPPSVGRCPGDAGRTLGQYYERHSYLAPQNVTWSWHPPPMHGGRADRYPPFAAGSWVEVMHVGGIDDEHVGAWFLHAKGSGISLQIGKTIVFDDHAQAHVYFGAANESDATTGPMSGARNEAMCESAAAAGYDTIQFVRHTCSMMYGQCRNASEPALDFFNIEIVATRLVGYHACASSTGSSPLIRSGWRGVRPCNCNNSIDFLNCLEVAPSGRATRQREKWHMHRNHSMKK